MSENRILITGASGFIGKALVKHLSHNGYTVRCTVRSEQALESLSHYITEHQLKHVSLYNLGELNHQTDWSSALPQVDTIVHCAARAHVLNETSDNPLKLFRQINCEATERLLQQAQHHNVKRIIFISSIGVLGNSSQNIPFTDHSTPNPTLPYAQSKLEAEQTLVRHAKQIETVIIRPPLVYGSGVKGNFKKLLDLIDKGLPLPFGSIKNKRQFIGIDNLLDFINLCIESPKAANQSFVVADQETLNTTELIKLIAELKSRKLVLLPIPAPILKWCFQAIGKEKMAVQLLSNLEIVTTNASELLGWKPPFTMLEQMKNTIWGPLGLL